jgi:hypothetical protein
MACASRKRCLFFDRHVPEYTLSASRGTNREYGAVGHERVLCILAVAALENAVQSGDFIGICRQLIELRAAQKLNAGRLESDGSVLVGADDI